MATVNQAKLDLVQRSINSGLARLQITPANSKERKDILRLIRMLERERDQLKKGRR